MCISTTAEHTITISGAGSVEVNGVYRQRNPAIIPDAFSSKCKEMSWNPAAMWEQLSDDRAWFESENGSYIYHNVGDGKWWIDGPSGAGVYTSLANTNIPPTGNYKPLANHRLKDLKVIVEASSNGIDSFL